MKQLVLIVLLTACSGEGPPCHFALDPTFTDAEVAAIDEGAKIWFEATNGAAVATFSLNDWPGYPGGHYVIKVQPGVIEGGVAKAYHRETLMKKVTPGHIALSTSEIEPWKLKWVVAHELGHHWGLWKHSPDPNDLMHAPSAANISENDVARFCALNGC